MITKGMNVQGIDFKGNEIQGKVEHIVGFGDVAIVKIDEDRLGMTECYVSNLKKM